MLDEAGELDRTAFAVDRTTDGGVGLRELDDDDAAQDSRANLAGDERILRATMSNS